jgi:hypothetical protein
VLCLLLHTPNATCDNGTDADACVCVIDLFGYSSTDLVCAIIIKSYASILDDWLHLSMSGVERAAMNASFLTVEAYRDGQPLFFVGGYYAAADYDDEIDQ